MHVLDITGHLSIKFDYNGGYSFTLVLSMHKNNIAEAQTEISLFIFSSQKIYHMSMSIYMYLYCYHLNMMNDDEVNQQLPFLRSDVKTLQVF
jgi:hypothetical protein